jgi:hypothetical protein
MGIEDGTLSKRSGGDNMGDPLDYRIIPGIGAAGIKIGDTEEFVLNSIGEPIENITFPTGVTKMIYKGVTIWLNSNRRVMQIGLSNGYRGQSSDGLHIGMSRDKLKELWGYDLAYLENDNYWEFISRPGTLFEFSPDEQGGMRVTKIYISE